LLFFSLGEQLADLFFAASYLHMEEGKKKTAEKG
jgi:hypothetical protein